MGIGTSILLIAVGAILKFAVTASAAGIELETVGVILMVVGVVGLVLTLLLAGRRRDAVVVESEPLVRERRL